MLSVKNSNHSDCVLVFVWDFIPRKLTGSTLGTDICLGCHCPPAVAAFNDHISPVTRQESGEDCTDTHGLLMYSWP